jgi:ABC-type amino acid transport substrate-binding protein
MLFSESYLDETLALVVSDHRREQFLTWDAIRDLGAIKIVVPDVQYYVDKLRELLPRAVLDVQSRDTLHLPIADAHADALLLPAERGSAWTLMYPEYTVVVPGPDPIRAPLGFPIGKRDEQFASFINSWITLKRKDGTLDAAYKYWILGQDSSARQPRWSIARNVLHWME